MLGLRFCGRAFSSCGKRGPLFITARGPLTVAASLVAEHRLQMRRLSNCGSRAQLLRGTRDPPRPGLEPVSPALAGRFSTTAPPGKPERSYLRGTSSLLKPSGRPRTTSQFLVRHARSFAIWPCSQHRYPSAWRTPVYPPGTLQAVCFFLLLCSVDLTQRQLFLDASLSQPH